MIWMMIAAVCAFYIKGLCGFANTLVFTTILSFKINNINISPMELLLGYPSNLILAFQERKSIQWNICLPLAFLVLLGNIPGIFLLKHTDTRIIKILFGIVVILIGIEMFFREKQKTRQKSSQLVLGIIGFLSGVLCGLYGIGALLAAYVSRVTDDTKAFRANLSIVFIVENTFRVLIYSFTNIISPEIFFRSLLLIPAMLAGLFLGIKSSSVLDEKLVRKLVIIMLILSGLALVVNNLR